MALVGDGGLALSLGEISTLVQERAHVALIAMNDRGYGVIRNIQDRGYGGRHLYTDLALPDLAALAGGLGLPFRRVGEVAAMRAALDWAIAADGPAMVEIDMTAIGPFAIPFAGPPVRRKD